MLNERRLERAHSFGVVRRRRRWNREDQWRKVGGLRRPVRAVRVVRVVLDAGSEGLRRQQQIFPGNLRQLYTYSLHPWPTTVLTNRSPNQRKGGGFSAITK